MLNSLSPSVNKSEISGRFAGRHKHAGYESLPYLVICLLTLIYNFPLLVPGMGNMQGGDFVMFYLPFRIVSSMQLHMGDLPFRAGEIFGGYPIWQDPQFSLLYPINLLFGLLVPNFATETVIDLYMLVNLVVLSLSSVFFIRSAGISRIGAVAGACVICFTGFTVTHGQYLAMLQIESMSLLAGAFLIKFFRGGATNFRFPLAAGLVLAVGNLAGNPQPIVYFHYGIAAGVAILAFELWRRTGRIKPGARMAAGGITAFVFGIVLSAIHLVPAAYLISISARAEVLRDAAVWSPIQPKQLSMMLFPGFYQMLPWQLQWPPYAVNIDLSFTNLVEGYIPIGLFAAALGLLGWFQYSKSVLVQATGWGSVLLLACAVGDALPFYGWLYNFFPGISLLRVATRILLVFFPAWGILVALGVQALWRNEPGISRSARYVTLFLLFIVSSLTAYAFVGKESWIMAWVGNMAQFVQDYVYQNAPFFLAHLPAIIFALKIQIACGLFFLAGLILLFSLPGKFYQVRVISIISFMCVEIFLYSFGWNMAINTPPLNTGTVKEYTSYPPNVKGRTVGLHGVYSGPINAALYMDTPPLANGYSVTYDKWVGAFLPMGEPPWSVGQQRVFCDLWNVTDLAFPRRLTQAKVAGQLMTVGDWGWNALAQPPAPESGVTIDIGRKEMLTTFTMAFPTDKLIANLHILGIAGESASFPDGTELGRVTVKTERDDEEVSAVVRLGEHFSDPFYQERVVLDVEKPKHSIAPIAFQCTVPHIWTRGGMIYDAKLDLATSAPVVSVEFTVTAPFPVTFGISHVVAILEDGTSVTREAFETAGFKKSESTQPELYTLRRDKAPGYIRLFSTAVGSSYKKTEYVLWKIFSGEIDPLKTLVVDKRLLDEKALQKLNTPSHEPLRGTAKMIWKNEENAVIQAETNQPGWIFLSYAWDAGWSAEINGLPTDIYRANGPFMAIPVKAGRSEIVMHYRPKGLMLGGAISAIALAGFIGAWVYSGRRLRDKVHPA